MVAPVQHRSSFQVMRDTVSALMIRELKTRFGSSRLGYFWAVVEPAAQAAILSSIWALIGRNALAGVPIALFMVVGLLSFKTFMKLITQVSSSITSNKGVMGYRQVEPIDPVITRALIEIATFVMVFFLLLWCMYWFFDINILPFNWLGVVAALSILFSLSIAIGVVLCSAVEYWKDVSKIVGLLSAPMMLISGIFYSASMIPKSYWYLFQWNPIMHGLELMRESYFYGYSPGFGSWEYMIWLNLSFWFCALLLYSINRRRFKIG